MPPYPRMPPKAGKRKATDPPAARAGDDHTYDLGAPYGTIVGRTNDPHDLIGKKVSIPWAFWKMKEKGSSQCTIDAFTDELDWKDGEAPAPAYVIQPVKEEDRYPYPIRPAVLIKLLPKAAVHHLVDSDDELELSDGSGDEGDKERPRKKSSDGSRRQRCRTSCRGQRRGAATCAGKMPRTTGACHVGCGCAVASRATTASMPIWQAVSPRFNRAKRSSSWCQMMTIISISYFRMLELRGMQCFIILAPWGSCAKLGIPLWLLPTIRYGRG